MKKRSICMLTNQCSRTARTTEGIVSAAGIGHTWPKDEAEVREEQEIPGRMYRPT